MSWIEKRLSELAEDGYFEDLPGSGRPISDIDKVYSPTWWATRWIERDAANQSSKAMRTRLNHDIVAALRLPRNEARVRLAEIASGVDELNRLLDTPQQLPAVDVELVMIRGGLA
ncbi:MAG: DUF1992 domain-containing protein [Acidimicrobiia bacterium]|nr:DUF1992 domain-containing protein [Acidimicrobiia bacterium]